MTWQTDAWAAILRERRTPVLVTLLALIVFLAGFHIPLPGLTQDALAQAPNSRPYSVFALGLTPWMAAAVIAELVRLALTGSRLPSFFKGPHASLYSRPVIAMALALAAFQGYGIAIALESMGYMNAGPLPMLLMTISLMAGTAIIISLGRFIDRAGLGMGFWLLLAAGSVLEFAALIPSIPGMLSSGQISSLDIAGWVLVILLAIGAMTALLTLRRKSGTEDIHALLWPLLIAPTVLPAVLASSYLLPYALSGFPFAQFRFVFPLAGALLVILFILIYAPRDQPRVTTWLTVLVIGIEFFITEMQWNFASIPMHLNNFALVLSAYFGVSLLHQHADYRRITSLKRVLRRSPS